MNAIKEIRALTGIRGIASLFVATGHAYVYFAKSNPEKTSIFYNSFWSPLLLHNYLSVDIFFILSAFVITLSSTKYFINGLNLDDYKKYMQKRWIRIYPAYFIVIVFIYIVVLHFHRTANFIVSTTILNLAFALPPLLVPLWSLSAEWITYLIYPFLFKVSILKKSKIWNYFLLLIGLMLVIAASIKNHLGFNHKNMLDVIAGYPALIRCFGDYFLGIGAFYIYRDTKMKFWFNNYFSILVSVLFIACFCSYYLDIPLVFLSTLLIVSISKDNNYVAKFLGSKTIYFLGIISYPLYLTHYIIIEKLEYLSVFLRQIISVNHPNVLLFFVFMLCSVSVATAFTYWIETPIIKYLNNKLLKKNNQSDEVSTLLLTQTEGLK